MKKIFIFIFLLAILAFSFHFVAPVLAQGHPEEATIREATSQIDKFPSEIVKEADLNVIVGKVIKYLLGIIGIIALLVFLYSGIMWMTSGGNEQTIGKAQKSMIWAALGLFAVFVSYSVVRYVITSVQF